VGWGQGVILEVGSGLVSRVQWVWKSGVKFANLAPSWPLGRGSGEAGEANNGGVDDTRESSFAWYHLWFFHGAQKKKKARSPNLKEERGTRVLQKGGAGPRKKTANLCGDGVVTTMRLKPCLDENEWDPAMGMEEEKKQSGFLWSRQTGGGV